MSLQWFIILVFCNGWQMTGPQVAAALLALQVIPGAAGSSGGSGQQQEQQLPLAAEVPQLGPELIRLLHQPGSNAQELYGLWQQGVPLEALGSMHSSGNMPVSAVGFSASCGSHHACSAADD